MKLATTDTQLHGLEAALEAVRESSTTVKVDKLALKALLADHIDLNSEVLRKRGTLPETTP